VVCRSPVLAETKYIPSVTLSEQYDSNIFLGPKGFVTGGRQAWDLATTLSTNIDVVNKSRLGDSALSVGVQGGLYAYNTDLSYVSTNVFGTSDLSKWTNELVPGLKLQVSDSFLYTPEPPAFLTGGRPSETSDVFTRGIQAVRANTYTNTASLGGTYAVSRSIGLRANYSYSIFKVGQFFLTPTTGTTSSGTPVGFFDTNYHSVSAGPTYQFGRGDTLFLQYNYISVESSGEGDSIAYAAHTIEPQYMSTILPGYTLTIAGGATAIEGAENKPFFSGRLSLLSKFDRPTQVYVSLSRQVAPAFFGNGGAIITNVAQLSVFYSFSKVLRLTLSGNYAYGESTPQNIFSYTSITGLGRLDYKLTRSTTVSLSQQYSHYSYSTVSPFDRILTTVSLTTAWK
jgi:hypothetical protein